GIACGTEGASRGSTDPQCRAEGPGHAGAGSRGHLAAGENAVQGTGEAPSSGREWRRPLNRGPLGGNHPVLQLPQIGRVRLTSDSGTKQPSPAFRTGLIVTISLK